MKKIIFVLMLGLCVLGRYEVVIANAAPVETATAAQRKEQCRAITRSGNRCKRHAVSGKHYCHQHASDVTPKTTPDRCRAMTKKGTRCEAKPVDGKNYCPQHCDEPSETGEISKRYRGRFAHSQVVADA